MSTVLKSAVLKYYIVFSTPVNKQTSKWQYDRISYDLLLDVGISQKFKTQKSNSDTNIYGAEAPSISKHLEQERNLAITLVRKHSILTTF